MQFFQFNNEKRFGIKKLSDADLGFSETSNQTHIGLYENVLTYLDNSDVVKSALLVYEDSCIMLDCLFDRIEMPSGRFRSPKIRKGFDGNSIVNKIREIAGQLSSLAWYLVWAGLESGQLVFWLFYKNSDDYRLMELATDNMSCVIKEGTPSYDRVSALFRDKLNGTSTDVQKDIEVESQSGNRRRRYRKGDLERADELFRRIGKKGEEIIAQYLERQKALHNINSYKWMNANFESGDPFDFIIDENTSTEKYIDVKSTRFDFNQLVYYSNGEVEFVNEINNDSKYFVYRLYDMNKDLANLRVCSECLGYLSNVNSSIAVFERQLNTQQVMMQGIKLGVKPQICFSQINPAIKINTDGIIIND